MVSIDCYNELSGAAAVVNNSSSVSVLSTIIFYSFVSSFSTIGSTFDCISGWSCDIPLNNRLSGV